MNNYYIALEHQGEDGYCEICPPFSSRRKLGRYIYRGFTNRSKRVRELCIGYIDHLKETGGDKFLPISVLKKKNKIKIRTLSERRAKYIISEYKREHDLIDQKYSLRQEDVPARYSLKVFFSDGDSLVTSINGTKKEVRNYYVGKTFVDSNEKARVCTHIKFL